SEWLSSDKPLAMLAHLQRAEVSPRKLRLFACGCYRLIWNSLNDRADRCLIKLAELYADLTIGGTKLYPYQRYGWGSEGANPLYRRLNWFWDAIRIANTAPVVTIIPDSAGSVERLSQATLLRCIFGNPFRQITAIDPSWLAWNGGTV